jgi:hypothetical protein
MDTKARLINLESVLEKNSVHSTWEKENCLLIKSKPDGFDIKVEYTNFDIFLWFDEIFVNVHPKEFDELIYYFRLAFSGQLQLQKTMKNEKVVKYELFRQENNNLVTELLIDNKDHKFWVKEKTQVLENDYRINPEEFQNI